MTKYRAEFEEGAQIVSSDLTTQVNNTVSLLREMHIEMRDEKDLNDLAVLNVKPSIAVIGLVSRGKSTLVNKLIGQNLLATGPNPVTFGNGFLESGVVRAVGLLADGTAVDLPSDVDSFRHLSRRHDEQQFSNFRYTGSLRLPPDVTLIDTKGLDEVTVNFTSQLEDFERSWATQGAIGAVLVTSAPPGASAQDVRLFQALKDHFEEEVVVVVKQTDRSLDLESLEEVGTIWREYDAEVLVIGDHAPNDTQAWGSGPLAVLENRMSAMWSKVGQRQELAKQRLVQRLAQLSLEIPALPAASSANGLSVTKYWSYFEDTTILDVTRRALGNRLVQYYDSQGGIPTSIDELGECLRYLRIGSREARGRLCHAFTAKSALRIDTSLTDALLVVINDGSHDLVEVCMHCTVRDQSDFRSVSDAIAVISSHHAPSDALREQCATYVRNIRRERELLEILAVADESLVSMVVIRLIELWSESTPMGTTTLDGNFQDLVEVLKERKSILRQASKQISIEVGHLLKTIRGGGRDWGDDIYDKFEVDFLSQRDYATNGRLIVNPFDQLVRNSDRMVAIIERIAQLKMFLTPPVEEMFEVVRSELGDESPTRVWAKTIRDLAQYSWNYRAQLVTLYSWIAATLGILLLAFINNRSLGGSVFIGILLSHVLFRRWRSIRVGPFRMRPFDSEVQLRGREGQIRMLSLNSAAVVMVAVAAAAIVGRLDPFQELASEGVPSLVTETQLIERSESTTTVDSDLSIAIDSDDLVLDSFVLDTGNLYEVISTVELEESSLGLVFGLSSDWDWVETFDVRYCWADRTEQLIGCQDATADGFVSERSGYIFYLPVVADRAVPAGIYRLSIDFYDFRGRILTDSELELLDRSDETVTTTSLPYRYDRNRFWNANCPRILTENLLLPLKLCDKGEGVRRVQFLLGIDADGNYGNATHNAVVDFQVSSGIVPTGIVDSETWYQLDPDQGGPGVDTNGDGLVTPDEFD